MWYPFFARWYHLVLFPQPTGSEWHCIFALLGSLIKSHLITLNSMWVNSAFSLKTIQCQVISDTITNSMWVKVYLSLQCNLIQISTMTDRVWVPTPHFALPGSLIQISYHVNREWVTLHFVGSLIQIWCHQQRVSTLHLLFQTLITWQPMYDQQVVSNISFILYKGVHHIITNRRWVISCLLLAKQSHECQQAVSSTTTCFFAR